MSAVEKSVVHCSATSCQDNFCPRESFCCMRKFVNINGKGQCADFRGKKEV
jgi:hypothetical protein